LLPEPAVPALPVVANSGRTPAQIVISGSSLSWSTASSGSGVIDLASPGADTLGELSLALTNQTGTGFFGSTPPAPFSASSPSSVLVDGTYDFTAPFIQVNLLGHP
jgi:hypothetical protein